MGLNIGLQRRVREGASPRPADTPGIMIHLEDKQAGPLPGSAKGPVVR